ncbi:recombinase family protein [Alsobacter sp. R-9]
MSIAASTRTNSATSSPTSSSHTSPSSHSSSPPLPSSLAGAVQGELFPRPQSRLPLRARAIVPRTLDEALGFARAVVAARMAPAGLDTPEACMIAILHGLEVGLTPLSALQRIAVIGGRPTIWGDGAMALVRASGLAAAIDERVDGAGPTDWVAVCTVRRRGEPLPVERRFSVDDARRARLWGKPGPWSDYPRRMLQMRARAFALRDVFADVLGGLYLREEVEGVEAAIADAHLDTVEVVEGPGRSGNAGGSPLPVVEQKRPLRYEMPPRGSTNGRPRVVAPPPPGWGEAATTTGREPAAGSAASARAEAGDLNGDVAGDSATASMPPLPALTRRRTASAREAQRLRYAQGWAVGRPRTLQPKSSTPQPARRSPRDPVATETTTADPSPAPASHDDVSLFDDALSCARDRATLDEIVQEFTPRLSKASREIRAAAARVLNRHRQRVVELEQPKAYVASRPAGNDGEPSAAAEVEPGTEGDAA